MLERGAPVGTEIASELPRRPRPEDFGLTEEMVRDARGTLFGTRRGAWIVGIYGVIAIGVFAAVLAASGSLLASIGLTVIAVAAASVLMVPAITGLVCALEFCERCWLCRRRAHFEDVERFRSAVEEHETALRRHAAEQARTGETFWQRLDASSLVDEMGRLFEARGVEVERLPVDRSTGFDLVLRDGGGRSTAVRCEAGGVAAGRSLGYEMEGARADLGADRMVLVAPAGASAELRAYLAEHHGEVVDAQALSRLRAELAR